MSSRVKSGWEVGLIVWILAGVCAYAVWDHCSQGASQPGKEPSIEVMFSPNGGCQERILEEIGKAKKRIRVQVYIFSSKEIADAIIEAKKHGVDCEIIVDRSQEKMVYGRLPVLKKAGVTILVDAEHETANNKIMLIDDDTIITGSYNYTKAAEEKNAENLLIIKNYPDLFAKYASNFEAHKGHSKAYQK
ncbi:MAG TPA: phospholipase D family protein [Phycisphaerae bacterium]|nr:phospholipase D family protein [Phycisphaerae bacterium]